MSYARRMEERATNGLGGLLAWFALLLCLSCGSVKKAEDTGAEGGAGGSVSEQETAPCADYCDKVMAVCVGEHAVYASHAACLALCGLLDTGDFGEPAGNTLACRSSNAIAAEREPNDYCAAAGPGGNGTCGTDCETYCALYPQVCPAEADAQGTESCVEDCQALVDQPGFDVVADHGGDTVECRLVHLTSATLQPAEHCQHAQLAPTQPWCVAEP
jgi:hypothetical protein